MAGSDEIAKLAVSLSLEAQGFDKQMSSINKSIKNAERDFKSAGKGVDGFEKSFVGLDAKIQKTSKQLDLYNTKLSKQKEEYSKLQGDLKATTQKLEELERTQGKGSEEWKKQAELVQKNAEKLNKLGTDINTTESNMSKLTSELNQSQKEFEQLGNKAKSLDENLEEIGRQADLTQSEFDKLGSELQTSGNYFSKLGNEMNKLSGQITSGNQKIDAYENEIRKLGTTLDKNKQDHSKLGQEINKVEQELNQAKSSYGENSAEAQKLKAKLLQLKDEYNNLESEIEQNSSTLDKYQTELNQTQAEVNQLSNELRTMPFDKIGSDLVSSGQAIKGVGQTLTTGITLPLVAVGAAATKVGVDFDRTMSKVSAISGDTGESFEQLKNKALELGSSTKFSASEVAEAMTYMGMAGWDATQMMDGVEGILNLAAAGAVDLATASDIVTDGLTAMGMTAKDSGDFVDMMAATITGANTSVELMGETMKYAAPVAGALGIEMEDLSVAIGLMGNAGIKGSQAGTALRGGLTRLVDPTSDAASAMKEYGVELVKNEDETVNLEATMQNLRATIGTLDATTQAQVVSTIFGKEAMSGWMAVINASDSDMTNLTNSVKGSTKVMQYWSNEMEKAGMSTEETQKNLAILDQVFEECKMTADYLGMSSADLGKVITLLGQDGKVTTQEVEGLLNAMFGMINPSEEAKTAMTDLGIEIKKFDNGAIDTNGTLQSLRDGLKGLSDEERNNVIAKMGLVDSQEQLNELLSLSDEEFNTYIESLDETKGASARLAETMQENLGGAIDNMKSALEGAMYDGFKAFEPVLQSVIEKVTELANWFTSLDEEQQQNIVTIAAVAGAMGPLLMIVGQLIVVGGNAVTLFGKLSGASSLATKGIALLTGPVGIGALVLALGGLMTVVGDSEDAILKLQEKFGSLGTIIGGVCEFVSGIVQLTFGNVLSWIQLAMDGIAAMIDGPGGATIEDAWENHNKRLEQNTIEGMNKVTLATTRGMSQMRNASDEQLNGTIASMDTILSQIPAIVDGNYSQASSTLGQQLSKMDSTQITILQGMNDTTEQMFLGIREGMNVDEATAKVEQNLKRMAENGTLDAGTMEKEVTKALEQMKSQMDTKTKEGATAVDTNTKDAKDKANKNTLDLSKDVDKNTKDAKDKVDTNTKDLSSKVDTNTKDASNKADTNTKDLSNKVNTNTKDASNKSDTNTKDLSSKVDSNTKEASNKADANTKDLSNKVNTNTKDASSKANTNSKQMANEYTKNVNKMAIDANKELSKVPQDVDTQMAKAGQATKQHASDMYNGVTTSFSKMASNTKQSASDMYNGTTSSASKMASNAKQSASDMYSGVTTSTSRMATSAIQDWERVRATYSRTIRGEIVVTTRNVTVNETVTKSSGKSTQNYSNQHDIQNDDYRMKAIDIVDMDRYSTKSLYYNSNKSNRDIGVQTSSLSKLENLLTGLVKILSDNKSINQENNITIISNEPLSPSQIAKRTRKELENFGRWV